jgi:hypothetical protein
MLRKLKYILENMNNIIQQTFSRAVPHKKSLLAVVGILAVALLALALPAWEGQAQQRGNPFTLAGTWMHSIPPAPLYPYSAYETFTEGGGSVIMDHGIGGPSAGIGTWTRIGPREFLSTTYRPTHRPADAGPFPFVPNGTIKARRHIVLSSDGQTFTGQAMVEVYDQEGNLIISDGGAFTSTRLYAEPLFP